MSGSGSAVHGNSTSGFGVYGLTAGAVGSSAGVFGYAAGVATAPALLGINTNANGYAGWFEGPVVVNGGFTVTGAKSAAVDHPDGTLRRVYCQESPEPWFEDFGAGQLAAGRAAVRLDPDFTAIVKSDEYGVFLTPEGDCKGLYVTAKTPAGFDVREQQGGTSSIPFRFRVVAKRKDIPGPRLEKVERPKKLDPKSLPGIANLPEQPGPTPRPSQPATTQATPVPAATSVPPAAPASTIPTSASPPTSTPVSTPPPASTTPMTAPIGSPGPSPTPTV